MSVGYWHPDLDEDAAEERAAWTDEMAEDHDRRLEERGPLPGVGPMARVNELYGMSARDPELPKAA